MSLNVAVIGGGIEGKAACTYWLKKSAQVTLHDRSVETTMPAGVLAVLGPNYLHGLNSYDLIVRSPGIKPRDLKTTTPVTSGIREFFQHCPARIIGVTGTKGKGTTATLIAKICEEAGKRVWLGGNIGRSPLDFLANVKASDIVVLELSSFQLMDLDISPHVGVCLMVVSEHLDWHRNIREYVAAKGNLFWHQQPGDIAVYNPQNDFSTQIALLSPGIKLPYLEKPGAYLADGMVKFDGKNICRIEEVGLIGAHNLENVCAAITAAQVVTGTNMAAITRAVIDFKGLEHRLEFVRELNGVRYFDDSFATTPETAMAAIAAFDAPKVIILGGSDKKSKFTELARMVATSNVRTVILVGNTAHPTFHTTAPIIESALRAQGFTDIVSLVQDGGCSTQEIVVTAQKAAQPGDVVLLSPACASFEMYTSYKQRGDEFKAAVRELKA
jgi:UDP-N-acetylmuramoylalanine--D-glutamate ligase